MTIRKKFQKKVLAFTLALSIMGCGNSQNFVNTQSPSTGRPLPAAITEIFAKDVYKGATIAYRVADLDTGEVLYDQNSSEMVQIASCRKLFIAALALESLGGNHRYNTPVYRQGAVSNGVLDGNLVLVASGDFTMGARRGPNGTLALMDIDHSEANNLGNGLANPQDPLAGYKDLAREVAASGIQEIQGDVVIDDRLFEPFDFRGEYMANSVFVNDNMIDVQMSPGLVGQPAQVVVSPLTEAFSLVSTLQTVAGNAAPDVETSGGECVDTPGCQGTVSGILPIDSAPPFTGVYPLLRTFRVTSPSSFARTVFIEALRDEGVTVSAATVAPNPAALLPSTRNYSESDRVALLTSERFAQYVNFVFKTSYNLGSEMILMTFGVSQNAFTHQQAKAAEAKALSSVYGIAPSQYSFPDGHGGGETLSTATTLTTLLSKVSESTIAKDFRDSLTVIGTPGLTTAVPAVSNDPTLVGSIGQVLAKSGTRGRLLPDGDVLLETRASAGYITSKSGRRLVFFVAVNKVGPFEEFSDTMPLLQDIDTIPAIWWREL